MLVMTPYERLQLERDAATRDIASEINNEMRRDNVILQAQVARANRSAEQDRRRADKAEYELGKARKEIDRMRIEITRLRLNVTLTSS